MQQQFVTQDDNQVVLQWRNRNQDVSFKVNKAEFIQLACRACKTPLPYIDPRENSFTCQCGHEITTEDAPLNHRVGDYGRWTSYFGRNRCKDYYDVLLKNGDVVQRCYPNGASFAVHNDKSTVRDIKDEDVLMIRLVPDNELGRLPTLRGRQREYRNIEYYGDAFPRKERVTAIDSLYTILV